MRYIPDTFNQDSENLDMVNSPAHYQGKTFEVIDIINDYSLTLS